MNTIHIGVVKFFNVGRLYGFITDDETGKDYFCHNNGLSCHIKKGDKVIFELADCPKGVEAINITLLNNNKLLNILCDGKDHTKEHHNI
jgi:CspA family cold shock protein